MNSRHPLFRSMHAISGRHALLWQNSDLQSLVLNFDGPAVFIRKMLLQGRPCRVRAVRTLQRTGPIGVLTFMFLLPLEFFSTRTCIGVAASLCIRLPRRALFPHRGPSPAAPCPSPTVLHPITGHAAPQHPRADDARRLWQSSSGARVAAAGPRPWA